MFCYQKSFANPTLPVDEAQFWALVRAPQWADTIDQFRQTGAAQLKRRLPAFIFQATFDDTTSKHGAPGAWRKQAATHLTGLVVMDVDHVDNPRHTFARWQGLDLARLGILLVYVTPSGHGLKVVFKADVAKGNLIDNQHAMAQVLGVTVDESCKDASRLSFICKEADILHIDNELFTYQDQAFAQRFDADYRAGKSAPTAVGTQAASTVVPPAAHSTAAPADVLWHGHSVQAIIDARYAGNLPCAAQSNRHSESLKLASDLLVLFDGDRDKTLGMLMAQPWVQEIVSERGENVAQTVESAAQRMAEREKKYLSMLPGSGMQEAIKKLTGLTYRQIANGPAGRKADADMGRWLWEWGMQIEDLASDYPLLRDICRGLRPTQYPAALFVAGGLLMTLMTRCTYRFYHRPEELRRLNNSTIIIGDPASGKSFATRLFKLLAEPMVAADQEGIAAINSYKEQMKTKGANKEKPQRPKALFRVHPARTSNAQFIQDMVNAVEVVDGQPMQLHMLTFDTELDNTLAVQKGGSWIDKQSMELKAFHNEEDGQAYSNLDSVVQNFFVTWNYIYTGTPMALKKKVNAQNFGGGLATRLTCIPLPATNFEMLERERTPDTEADERLRAWAYKLDRMKGELSLSAIVDELYDWTARRMADAKDNDSRADEMLLKRCAYHGLNFAAPFIVMRHWDSIRQDGTYWCGTFQTDETDWRLTELLANIQYACQRHFFGALAEQYFDDKARDAATCIKRRLKTIEAYKDLPDPFTVDDVMRCFGMKDNNSARVRLNRLLKDRLAKQADTGTADGKPTYRKTGAVML